MHSVRRILYTSPMKKEGTFSKGARLLTKTVNAMPFEGKLDITPVCQDALRETDIYIKQERLERASTLLAKYTTLHLGETAMGVGMLWYLFSHNLAQQRPVDTTIALSAIAIYGAVTLTQSMLFWRMNGKTVQNIERIVDYEEIHGKPTKERLREAKRQAKQKLDPNREYYSEKDAVISKLATLAGSGVFLWSFLNTIPLLPHFH